MGGVEVKVGGAGMKSRSATVKVGGVGVKSGRGWNEE